MWALPLTGAFAQSPIIRDPPKPRAEAEAAHIRPVERGGPDSVRNGLALSGTAHWMFDRGLIGLSDDLDILISRQVNDRPSVEAIVNRTGKALVHSVC